MYTRTAFPYETTHEDVWIPPADGTRLYAGRGTRPRRPTADPAHAGQVMWRDIRVNRPEAVDPFIHTWLSRPAQDAYGGDGGVHGGGSEPCGRPGGGRLARPAAGWRDPPRDSVPRLIQSLPPGPVLPEPFPRPYVMDAHPPATTCASLPGRRVDVTAWSSPLVTPVAYALRGAPVLGRSPQHTGVDAGRFRPGGGDADLPPTTGRVGAGRSPRCATRPLTAPRPWSLGVPRTCQCATAAIGRPPRSRALRRTYVST